MPNARRSSTSSLTSRELEVSHCGHGDRSYQLKPFATDAERSVNALAGTGNEPSSDIEIFNRNFDMSCLL